VALDFSSAWLAACRGDHAAAGEAAAACVEHAEQADYPTFATMGRVVSGWAAAMDGDAAGLERMDDGYALHLSDGRRMHAPVLLVLRAEAHAHKGHLDVARDLVTQARDLARTTGERVLGPRLSALADRLGPVAD
jgi:predicted ATPase